MDDEGRAIGKAITGACNLAFFWLAVTGVYLWWPNSWKWRGLKTSLIFNRRLSGKARDWNWHNVIGFWSSSVLVVLTLTAAVMSYPGPMICSTRLREANPRPELRTWAPPQRASRGSGKLNNNGSPSRWQLWTLSWPVQNAVPGWTMLMIRFRPVRTDPSPFLFPSPARHNFARRS